MSEFQTHDLHLSAYLRALGFEMLRLERRSPNRAGGGGQGIFVFDLEDESESKIKSDFYSGQGVISALEYSNALKSLKSLVMA